MSDEKKTKGYPPIQEWGQQTDIEGMKFALMVSCGDVCMKKVTAAQVKGDHLGMEANFNKAVEYYERAIAIQEHRFKILDKVGVYG